VNPEGDETYFRSQTGNTRFYPVRLTEIALDDIAHMRNQLFAEAQQYYRDHPNDWWQLSPEAEQEAVAARDERRQPGVYEGRTLRDWLVRVQLGTVENITLPLHWEDVARACFHIPPERWSKAMQMEIGKAMVAAGWHTKPSRARGGVMK